MIVNILRRAWHRWRIITQVNGDFIARLTVVAFYYTIFALFAIGARLFADPLALKRPAAWAERKPVGTSIEAARDQS